MLVDLSQPFSPTETERKEINRNRQGDRQRSEFSTLWTWSGRGGQGSLFALVSVGLGHGLGQLHLKLVAAQRHRLVVGDKGEQRVEHQIVRQVELGAARLLA